MKIGLSGLMSLLLVSTALAGSDFPADGADQLRGTQRSMAKGQVAPVETTGANPDTIDAQDDDQVLLSNLMGTPVVEVNGETIGEVEDLLLTEDGRPEAIVISLGGILGVGGKDIAVPWTKVAALGTDDGVETLALGVRRETLEAAPAFQKSEVQGSTRVLVGMEELFTIAPTAGPPPATEESAE